VETDVGLGRQQIMDGFLAVNLRARSLDVKVLAAELKEERVHQLQAQEG